jgi:phosphoribosylanthranilate isomerase
MTWIKICGMTTSEAVHSAVEAGANAVGFVFAPSKRRVSVEQAARLAEAVPSAVLKVAVMQHPSQEQVDEVLTVFEPDVLQSDAQDFKSLRIMEDVKVLPVWRDGNALLKRLPPRLLYEGKVSGAGTLADWQAARTLARQAQLVLAGGLNAANVAQAIEVVAPFGVDVSSGVESAPGVKDPRKIQEFIRAVRTIARN